MERKLTATGILCFVALAGLSIASVSCMPVGKNAHASTTTQPRNKTNLDLKVEAVFHDGIVKKYMSLVNYVSSDSNGVLQTQVVQKNLDKKDTRIAKYTVFLQRFPMLNLSPSILNTTNKATCLREDDIRIKTGNLSLVWAPHKMEQSYTGLLRQCNLTNKVTTVITPPHQGKAWYLDSCLSGNPSVNSPRSSSLTKPAVPLYIIYVSTTDRVMMLNPLVNFDVSSFVRRFPFDVTEIDYVVVTVTSCTAWNKDTLKTSMGQIGYMVQEDQMSGAIVFVKRSKASSAPVPPKVTLKTTTTITPKNQVAKKVVTTRAFGFVTTRAFGFVTPKGNAPVPQKVTLKTTTTTTTSQTHVAKKDVRTMAFGFVTPKWNAPVPQNVTLKTTPITKIPVLNVNVKFDFGGREFSKPTATSANIVAQNVTLKTTKRSNNKSYVVQKDSPPVFIVVVNKPKASAAISEKPIGHLSLLIGIVGIGVKFQFELGLSGYFLW